MNSQPSKLKSALNFGALLGLVLMILTLVTFVLEMYEAKWLNYLSWAILIGGIAYGIKQFRDKENGGFISYGSALGYGTLVALFAGVITSFAMYAYLQFVDDGMVHFIRETQENALYEAGSLSDEQIEMQLSYMQKFTSPGWIAIWGVAGNAFMGFIVSLIVSIFLKKESDNIESL